MGKQFSAQQEDDYKKHLAKKVPTLNISSRLITSISNQYPWYKLYKYFIIALDGVYSYES
jgi:hypothetical protein